jgi:hypothetical protein
MVQSLLLAKKICSNEYQFNIFLPWVIINLGVHFPSLLIDIWVMDLEAEKSQDY